MLLLVALFNALAFATAAPFLYRRVDEANARSAGKEIGTLIQATIRPQGDVNVARILEWASWPIVEDAIVVDSNIERLSNGGILPRGVVLNPVGSARRSVDFDLGAVLRAALGAMQTGKPVTGVLGGRAVPIEGPRGIWGACWVRTAAPLDLGPLFANLVPWFLFSTLLLTGVTFFALRQLVLAPVEVLADGARRVRDGDLDTRLPEPSRTDEIADLMRAFNTMTATVRGFNERLRQEVDRATEEARRAQGAAMTQRRLAAMGELAAGIAHEINNPLGGLVNAVETLQRDDLSTEKRTQYLELLASGLERIKTTVSRLLRFTPRDSRMAAVAPEEVCADALSLVQHRATEEGVRTYLHLPGCEPVRVGEDARDPPLGSSIKLPRVLGARNELGQAVLNLLVNALDAHASDDRTRLEPPRIDVRLAQTEGGVEVTVLDDGPGVESEQLLHVSDLFYTTKDVGKGTGLGLSIVHKVVANHGGRVVIESRAGSGFSVRLWLPAYPGDPAVAAGSPSPGGHA